MKADDLKNRTQKFALSIIDLYRKLPKNGEAKVLGINCCAVVHQ